MSWTLDFGLVLNQLGGYGVSGLGAYDEDPKVDYIGSLVPRISTPLGNTGELYISAGIGAQYEREEWFFVPELLRTDLTWYFNSGTFKIGRMQYSDPLGFIAEGLFDGAQFTYYSRAGHLSLGAWYTGFLYRKRAKIIMTDAEYTSFFTEKLDYGDFFNTYFAPSRLAAALDWEHPSLGGSYVRAYLSLLGQIDFTGEDLHSQYITAKLTIPIKAFLFDLGGSFELIENSGDFGTAFAAEFRAAWMPPTPFMSRLSILGRYSSGVSKDANIYAFDPLTTKSQGSLIKAKLSGISQISLDYLARFNRAFSFSLTSMYFIRNDLETYLSYPVISTDDSGNFLGNEFVGILYWTPASDVTVNFGAGIFLPSLGNVAPKATNLWRVELNLILTLF